MSLQVVVADLNLFTTKDPMSGSYTQHTFDGLDNLIFNGVPDWVYEGVFIFRVVCIFLLF